jgi:hypothetical protein
MGHPANCGRDRENCKTFRSVHSILDLPTGKSATRDAKVEGCQYLELGESDGEILQTELCPHGRL